MFRKRLPRMRSFHRSLVRSKSAQGATVEGHGFSRAVKHGTQSALAAGFGEHPEKISHSPLHSRSQSIKIQRHQE